MSVPQSRSFAPQHPRLRHSPLLQPTLIAGWKMVRSVAPTNFFGELKRRNVIRATILYLGAVWALAQGISQLGPSVGAPEWATRWFLVAAGIGFPFWIAFFFFYNFTAEAEKCTLALTPLYR